MNEFEKFARGHLGISSLALDRYKKVNSVYRVPQALATVPSGAYINPSIIEERQMNVAVMDVFSRLMMDRIIFLGVPVTDDVANIIQAQLLFLDSTDSSSDIQLYINSPGGSVYAGLGIYDTMQLVTSDVATICTGMAASMASILLTAGEKGKRSALPHSRVMIHQVSSSQSGTLADLEIEIEQTRRCKNDVYKILADNTGHTFEEMEKLCDRNNWFIGQEAVDLGIADKVLISDKKEK